MNTENNNKWKKWRFMFIPLALTGMLAVSALVMFLWNWLMPYLFQWPTLSIWQAGGLIVLCRLLFGSFNFKGGRGKQRPPFSNPAFKEKFMDMSEEEKQAFKDQWKQRCGR